MIKVTPRNERLLVRKIETPRYSKFKTATIMNGDWTCGIIEEACDMAWFHKTVMFSKALAVALTLRDEKGEIAHYYLVKQELVVSTLSNYNAAMV